ncbi:MAG: molybdate ABC transporter substrate-binding protein [Silicimonas sp.]|nr:molybdate ABC transporter substrate-binding protein [Silicimonas sp.]
MKRWVLSLVVCVWGVGCLADEVRVAVASNFLGTVEALAPEFQADTGHSLVLSHGSTGQLYTQIDLGAPFDVFLAGDRERPALLLQNGKAREVRSYALGRLALVSRVPLETDKVGEAFAGRTAALADPIAAPYGKAATRAMERLKLDTATFRPILVANVGQVASVFATGNAEFAFVAVSQLPQLDAPHVLALDDLIPDIRQDAALLPRAQGNDAALAFWEWLFTPRAAGLIEAAGYGLPTE